jgi:hypothetical protein
MISQQKLRVLADEVLADDNVELAVAFGPSGPNAASITLVVDCRADDLRSIQRLSSALANRLQERLDVFRLADARPAAILMKQALAEGIVLKDENGTWEPLRSKRDEIVAEAEEHEDWAKRLHEAVEGVVEADDNVMLAVEFGPTRQEGNEAHSDMNLLLGCVDESDGVVLETYARLQETGFRIDIMQLTKARDFPYALSHIVRTGRPLKDTDGEWERLQSERDNIIEAGVKQHQEMQALKRLYGGPGGTSSLN